MLDETKNKLEWIAKRVPLDDMQEEYVGFILNEQEKMVKLLSAHIYAISAQLYIDAPHEARHFINKAIADILGGVLTSDHHGHLLEPQMHMGRREKKL